MHSLEPLRPWKVDQLGRGYLASTAVERHAVESADRVVAVSEAMRQDVLRLFAVDPARVVVLHNGVDVERYRRTADRAALTRYGVREPYVLFVGRISEQKGIFDLLRAVPLLPDSLHIVLCAASPDTPELEARLRQAVQGQSRVRWIAEMVSAPEAIQLYSHAAAFACPSVYEPFGVINLEAMACETPVIASAVGGILEVVEDGRTGILVPPSHPEDLARAIVSLLESPARAREMGMAGRRRVEALFSWERIAERTERLYADAIDSYRARPDAP